MRSVGLAFHEEALKHDTGPGHPECARRIPAILDALRASSLALTDLDVSHADRADLLRAHTAEHVDRIESVCKEGGWYPDPDTHMMPASWPAALSSAGAAIAACRAVLAGEVDRAFCPMRPPGHHAEHDQAMGFCLFNNVAVAARWLQAEAGVGKVAIVDWDVHHGNGTEDITLEDDSIFYASLHQHPLYPGTGSPDVRGRNNTNLNLRFGPGCDPDTWPERLEAEVFPALEKFDPDFLLLSAGFDAHRLDPLGSQRLENAHFEALTTPLLPVASGRIVSLLEGGYNLQALGSAVTAHVSVLAEVCSMAEKPASEVRQEEQR
jgi:acetoin utilization deacetylase AcuC-like enzyme